MSERSRSALSSCIYSGTVRHARYKPRPHNFVFPLYMLFLDLDEIGELLPESIWWSTRRMAMNQYRRSDFHGNPLEPLKSAVITTVKESAGMTLTGPIRMLTNLRCLGFSFNPVTFYYCYDAAGTSLVAIVAEVTNTPWKEKHAYVLTPKKAAQGSEPHRYFLSKALHVSPFMDMNHMYDWCFTEPGSLLTCHFQNLKEPSMAGPIASDRTAPSGKNDTLYFDATLVLNRGPLNERTLRKATIRRPLMAVRVITAIHWHALLLYLKRIPFHTHPSKIIGGGG